MDTFPRSARQRADWSRYLDQLEIRFAKEQETMQELLGKESYSEAGETFSPKLFSIK